MAHVNSQVASLRLDDATGAIATISGSTVNVTVNDAGGTPLLDDTGLGDARHTQIFDIKIQAQGSANGWLNSTTEAIFAPLVNGTSITKTIGIGLVSGQYLNGEVFIRNVQLNQAVGSIGTWSFDYMAQTTLTRTSVAQA